MPSLVVIGNPTARGFDRAVDAVLREVAVSGADARVVPTTLAEPGGPQARQALSSGADAVVAIGGDGTVREVATVLAHTGTPLGVMPAGTANLFARNLGLPLRDRAAAARIAVAGDAAGHGTGSSAAIDLGRVSLVRSVGGGASGAALESQPEPERAFLVVAGVGNDALAVEAASLRDKRRLGWAAYIAIGARRLASPSFSVRGSFDEGEGETTDAWSVLVHNAARIPAGFEVLPRTRLDDGLLHIAAVSPRRLAHWGRIAAAGAGIARAQGVLQHRTARRVTLAAVDGLLPVQLDGDAAGRVSRLDARIDRGALRVRVPRSFS
ncbi:diacylglycerol/lipid kinase family protein [Agrococcus sp. Marseille-P2731]|uniref:diacylglycerol/lipid kinase family protein n=1 Tax=Agrococcus sp. Marseille-P2731 TaxID=1841862 RepID=UPI0009316317|nr:diacylglycerol kinase family protein [Agrococcus sp. Marseille-P2731]